MDQLRAAIDYLINHHRLRLTRTQLVKLLYLADLDYYYQDGETLTGLDYAYYYYGPYNATIVEAANELIGDRITFERGVRRDGTEYYVYSPGLFGADPMPLSSAAKAILDAVATKWGRVPLQALLDYVYSETGPMKKARPGDQFIIARYAGKRA